MSSAQESRPTIIVEEQYDCTVEIGFQVTTVCTPNKGSVRVTIPYDGRYLKDLLSDLPALPLGKVVLTPTTGAHAPTHIPLALDTHDLVARMKSGVQSVLSATYPLAQPADTLLAVEGTVFDGADLRLDDNAGELYKLLFGQTDVFVNDLRLRLSLWVPDLLGQTIFDGETDELNRMLQEHESDTQVFMTDCANSAVVATHLAALANGSGGRIVFGVRANGAVVGLPTTTTPDQVTLSLLKAALLCSPPVPLLAPRLIATVRTGDGEPCTVASVGVARTTWHMHTVNQIVYQRRGALTIHAGANRAAPPAVPSERYIGPLRDILAAGSSRDVVVLDARNTPLSQLELGLYLCGLINANVAQGLLVIRNLVPEQIDGLRKQLLHQASGVVQQLEERMNAERRHITPLLARMTPEFTTVDGERIALVRVPAALAPAALYDNRGFVWDGGVLREIPLADVLARYLRHVGTLESQRSVQTQVILEEGHLSWPVQPPTPLKINHLAAQSTLAVGYDVQRRAMVWRAQQFTQQAGTNGLQCELTTRLRQAFDDPRRTADDPLPPLQGQLHIRFDHALASGTEVAFQPADGLPAGVSALLKQVSVQKRTHITVKLKIAANELFQNRRHMVLLHTRTPDIALGRERSERIADLQQAFADSGFWIYEVAPDTSDVSEPPYVIMKGIRSTDYCDIHLLAGTQYEAAQLTRELRYSERTDSKTVQSGLLDSRLVLWGTGDKAAEQIVQLQVELGDLIQERLQYLRSE